MGGSVGRGNRGRGVKVAGGRDSSLLLLSKFASNSRSERKRGSSSSSGGGMETQGFLVNEFSASRKQTTS